MRIFTFVLVVLITAISASAQETPLTVRAFENGTRAAQSKNYKTAIEDYRRAILFSEAEKTGDDFLARIHFNIGVCLYNMQQAEAAAGEFTEAIKLSRRSYQKAFYALGMAQVDLKNWGKAETAFRDAVKLKKDDGETWFDLGLVLLERKNYESAETAFRQSIKYESSGTADAHNNLGVIFALKADFSAAENEFVTALARSNGKSIEARNNLQFCKLYKRHFNQDLLAKLEFSRKNKGE
jgi:tetratricopeptide (TPR) repeat protein